VPQETGHRDYCEDIPVRGESVFVMEYQHEGLNDAEIDFRIIHNVTGKGNFARLGDVEAIEDLDAVTIRHAAATVVPDVFTMLQPFDADGDYIGIVSASVPETGAVYTAVFPFEVGYTGLGYWPWFIAALVALQLNFWRMNRRRKSASHASAAAAVLLACSVAPIAAWAEEPVWTTDSGHFKVSFVSLLSPLEINRIHSWIVRVESADGGAVVGATLSVDGGMPEHDHGLPTVPRVTDELGDGRYKVEGLRFHMRGLWEIVVTIDDGAERDSVTIPLTL